MHRQNQLRPRQDPFSALALDGRYNCEGPRVGVRGPRKTGNGGYVTRRNENVYGSLILIAIRILDPGIRSRCGLLHLRGVVSGAGHFVDAAGGYSDVDTCCAARFVAGTCALRFVTSRKPRCRSARLGCPRIARRTAYRSVQSH